MKTRIKIGADKTDKLYAFTDIAIAAVRRNMVLNSLTFLLSSVYHHKELWGVFVETSTYWSECCISVCIPECWGEVTIQLRYIIMFSISLTPILRQRVEANDQTKYKHTEENEMNKSQHGLQIKSIA